LHHNGMNPPVPLLEAEGDPHGDASGPAEAAEDRVARGSTIGGPGR
jgi:hypothetical protein